MGSGWPLTASTSSRIGTSNRFLKRIRKLREGGLSLRAIAAELNRRRLTMRQGSQWRMEYVARLLKAA
jgi:IS30 family transposase